MELNYAYATYHGRFGKTIGELPSINYDLYDLDFLEMGNISYVSPAHSEMLILQMEYLLGRKLL